jgi:hypothetical protein
MSTKRATPIVKASTFYPEVELHGRKKRNLQVEEEERVNMYLINDI